MLGIAAGWTWFGWSGLVPLMVWSWHARPRRGRRVQVSVAAVALIDEVHLGRWLTRVRLQSGARVEIWHDELPAPALARLRRLAKAACSVGDRAQDV